MACVTSYLGARTTLYLLSLCFYGPGDKWGFTCFVIVPVGILIPWHAPPPPVLEQTIGESPVWLLLCGLGADSTGWL